MWSILRTKKESDTPLPTPVHDNFWWIVLAAFIAAAAIFIFFPPNGANAATPATTECLTSARAVYAVHPQESGGWASWSFHVPEHAGKKCYFDSGSRRAKVQVAASPRKAPTVRRSPDVIAAIEAPPAHTPPAIKVTAASQRSSAQAFDHVVENLMSPAKPDHAPNDFLDRWDGSSTRFVAASPAWKGTIGFLEVGAHGRPLWALH